MNQETLTYKLVRFPRFYNKCIPQSSKKKSPLRQSSYTPPQNNGWNLKIGELVGSFNPSEKY